MENKYTVGIPTDKPHYRDGLIMMHLIDTALYSSKIQEARIVHEMDKKKDLMKLFGDIHFLFINIANIKDYLNKLCTILTDDEEIKGIYSKYYARLDHICKFRNHLEHISDDRLSGFAQKRPLTQPNVFGDLFEYEYNFGGDKVNLKDIFTLCDELSTNLKDWNRSSSVYPVWQ